MRSTVRIAAGGLALAAAVVLNLAGPAAAAPKYPAADGRCVDQVGVLGAGMCDRVTKVLLQDEKDSSDEIAVAVVPTTGDATIESWSTGLFNTWGVGKKSQNNGVLLVVAVKDHRVRLATGRGLAKRLDDRAAKKIIDDTITPSFARDAYAEGILAGLDEVRRTLRHRIPLDSQLAALAAPSAEPDVQPVTGDTTVDGVDFTGELPDGDSGAPVGVFLIVGLALVALLGFAARITSSGSETVRDHRRAARWHSTSSAHSATTDWSSSTPSSDFGGGSSSSSSDFGGGSSSGSGASGSW